MKATVAVLALVAMCGRAPVLPLRLPDPPVRVLSTTVHDGRLWARLEVPPGSGLVTALEYELWSEGRCVQAGLEPMEGRLDPQAPIDVEAAVPWAGDAKVSLRGVLVVHAGGSDARKPFGGAGAAP